MDYVQKILSPSRSNGPVNVQDENFLRAMVESIDKAINSVETPVKEKHVRRLLIGTHQVENGLFFWNNVPVTRLKENQIVCWKFCHVLHKMLRDGHRQVLANSYDRRQLLLDCGNMWRHVEDGYGKLIFKYCILLYKRTTFLSRNNYFPSDLKLTDEQLQNIGGGDLSLFFQLSCEIADSLDDILDFQKAVLTSLESKKVNSLTKIGRCHLSPLVACIQDSSMLYDYIVKILFKLHSGLPSSTLDGHRERFTQQHKLLKSFYLNASNLQFFRTLIQIPHLSDRPPNFLVASDLQQHVTPKVVMIANEERDSPDRISKQSLDSSQMLVNLNEDSTPYDSQQTSLKSLMFTSPSLEQSIDSLPDQLDSSLFTSLQSTTRDLPLDVEQSTIAKELETSIEALREELKQERIRHQETKLSLTERIAQIESTSSEKIQESEKLIRKLRDDLSKLDQKLKASLKSLKDVTEECERAKHDDDISKEAMKKLVKDMADLRVERQHVKVKQEIKAQEIELDETDRILREASKKIEEFSEKSRKMESGIKLQVNEKIAEVCTSLMKIVQNLIVQSRQLQQEIAKSRGEISNAGFYQKNSNWTEGLISAANVVAIAAKSLVDSADLAISGQARYSEIAAAAHEVASATTQLVVASRVKADKDSEKLKVLTSVAKQVNQCTSNVVDTARVCAELIDKEAYQIDLTSLTFHQTKKLEMETQVRMLELEDQLSKERIKLGLLRRQHYEQEDAQINKAAAQAAAMK